MFASLERSWSLFKASWGVLRQDKHLIVYPIVSFIGTIIVLLLFAFPFIATFASNPNTDDGLNLVQILLLFAFYTVMYTVIIFCNTALIGAALIRLKGGSPTLSDGFNIARERLGKIVGYALLSATVGMILRALRERGGLAGAILAWIGNVAWTVVTFLVIPVLVVEDVGPIDAIKRSGALLKKTWGEQITANFGIGAVLGLISFAVMIVGIALIALFIESVPALAVLAGILMAAALVGLGLLGSTLSGIYQAALYRYATEGVVDDEFSTDMIQGAFKPKRG